MHRRRPDRQLAGSTGSVDDVSGQAFDVSEEVTVIPIDALQGCYSPRVNGLNQEHVRVLSESPTEFPPILVHRPSMRVIDGMHRLCVARARHQSDVAVRFFGGDEHDAFILAVRTNITHGLPLSLADREAAAARVLALRPYASDRSVAVDTGLSPGTVSSIRRRTFANHADAPVRIGRDGRVRPVDHAERRRAASEVVAERPDAPLREIAQIAGVSPATARDVRDRMRRGDDPLLPNRRGNVPLADAAPAPASSTRPGGASRAPSTATDDSRDVGVLLQALCKDPSLRLSDRGRTMLRWLNTKAGGLSTWPDLINDAPPHCMYILVDIASRSADEWLALAAHLRQRLAD
jgi:hypothetical protein